MDPNTDAEVTDTALFSPRVMRMFPAGQEPWGAHGIPDLILSRSLAVCDLVYRVLHIQDVALTEDTTASRLIS